jgi:hypothetical protein
MYVVETMVGSCHRNNLLSGTHLIEEEAVGEVVHEPSDFTAGGRLMPTHGYVVRRITSKFAGCHREPSSVSGCCLKHRLRHSLVEGAVKAADEVGRGRFSQLSFGEKLIDFSLHPYVCACFDLKVPSMAGVQIVDQRSFDVARPGVVSLDQVAVVAVHDRHEVCQSSGGPRVKFRAQGSGTLNQLNNVVRERGGQIGEVAGLDSRW